MGFFFCSSTRHTLGTLLYFIHDPLICACKYILLLNKPGNVYVQARPAWTTCIALNFTVNYKSHYGLGSNPSPQAVRVVLDYTIATGVEKMQLLLLISAKNYTTQLFFSSLDYKWNCRWLKVPESSLWIIITKTPATVYYMSSVYIKRESLYSSRWVIRRQV